MAELQTRESREELARTMRSAARLLERLADHIDAADEEQSHKASAAQKEALRYQYTPWTWNPAIRAFLLRHMLCSKEGDDLP
jgi:hypothetical protein